MLWFRDVSRRDVMYVSIARLLFSESKTQKLARKGMISRSHCVHLSLLRSHVTSNCDLSRNSVETLGRSTPKQIRI